MTDLTRLSETKEPIGKTVEQSLTSKGKVDLGNLCKKLSDDGKESYWRGVFYGRPKTHFTSLGARKDKDFDQVYRG